MAGQVIIEGFLDIKFSVFRRRFITAIPALAVVGMKLDPLKILLLSQVALSFTLPFALVPLIMLTRRSQIMSDLVNNNLSFNVAATTTIFIIALHVALLF